MKSLNLIARALEFVQRNFALFSGVLAALSAPMVGPVWQWPVVIAALQLIAGWVQKRIPNEVWSNRVIPIANTIVGAFGYALMPVQAHAGFLDHLPALVFHPVVAGFVSMVITSGTHSAVKNTKQLARDWFAQYVLEKAAQYQSAPRSQR